MSSSSDESADEEKLKQLISSVDTSFFPDLQESSPVCCNSPSVADSAKPSQRHLHQDEDQNDLKVEPSMQSYFAKKLSEAIAKKAEFTQTRQTPKATSSKSNRKIYLLECSDKPILYTHLREIPTLKQRSKPVKARRYKNTVPQKQRLETSVISLENIQTEVSQWSEKTIGKVFNYLAKSHGILHFVEPENEFTEMRKHNCWSEKRIKR